VGTVQEFGVNKVIDVAVWIYHCRHGLENKFVKGRHQGVEIEGGDEGFDVGLGGTDCVVVFG
jgi:hypothetical protein